MSLPHRDKIVLRISLSASLVVCTLAAGCTINIDDPNDGNGDPNGPQPTPGPIVTIRFANLTDLAVLADVYVSTNGADLDPESIFINDNRLIDGVGLASTGVLVPQSTDQLDVACVDGMVVATTGGEFRDADTGEVLGVGPQRILQEGLVFDCGAIVTFVYRLEQGVYNVTVTLN